MKKFLAAVLVGILYLVPTAASADQISFINVGHSSAVQIGGDGGTKTVSAGELNWSWLNPAGGGSFYSYCVDVLNFLNNPQFVNVSSTDYMPDSATVADRGNKAAWLFNSYAADIRSSVDPGANLRAAALQVAIWEALYDSTFNLAAGAFTLLNDFKSGLIAGQASTYLTALAGANYQTSSAVWLDSYSLNGGGPGQDQITGVPEPATLLLMGVGGIALFRSRKRLPRREDSPTN